MKHLTLPLFIISAALCAGCSKHQQTSYEWDLPPNFPLPEIPQDNPLTEEKVELGRHLFYDNRLSANQTQNCSSCHLQKHAFSESLQHSIGSTGQPVQRNSLSLTNVAYNETFTWAHNELTSLERQIQIPLFNESPIELGVTENEELILERLKEDPKYQELFAKAFANNGSLYSFTNVINALASFVRTLTSFDSAFDQYAYHNDDTALNESELRGLAIFMSEESECRHCHNGFNFSQSTAHDGLAITEKPFHNTGLYNVEAPQENFDEGLYDVTLDPKDKGKFRAPTLRNLAFTAPYMHDGSIATLEEVVDLYIQGGRNITEGPFKGDGREHPGKSQFVAAFDLSYTEKQDLVNFLLSLSDESFINNERLSDPWE